MSLPWAVEMRATEKCSAEGGGGGGLRGVGGADIGLEELLAAA